ncbi:MAG: hypothetical protein WEB30_19895 [Cyclobacteriaceae bacterium]
MLLIGIAPWSVLDLCPNHPEGHEAEAEHHGSCADGMMGDHDDRDGTGDNQATYKPVPCAALSPDTDEYKTTLLLKPPTISQVIIAAILLDVITWNLPEQEFYPLPDSLNNLGPPPGANTLRGPPLV